MSRSKTIGLLPLGRATFDVPYATEKLAAMLAQLDAAGYATAGSRSLLFDSEATLSAMAELEQSDIDALLILQVTFTDAAMVAHAAERFSVPLSIWAVPEPRLGGRLRLNAFCGLNLASHALGLNNISFGWLYRDADEQCQAALHEMLNGQRNSGQLNPTSSASFASEQGQQIAKQLAAKRVACIGDHPEGFATCAYDPAVVKKLTGIGVEKIPLSSFFDKARQADADATQSVVALAQSSLPNMHQLDQVELDKSLRLKVALDSIRADGNFDAFAIRCWPETFTEYGGAVCGPVAMLGETKTPCACEADVFGAMTQLLLQEVAEAPVFLVDLVDVDSEDDSAVVWHCGQAPISMADPDVQPVATIHTNRKMPLLYEFPLKPGRVTFARLSQAGGVAKLILAGGDVIKRDMAFTGTSGVVRFDGGAASLLDNAIDSGLEHHLGLVYGEHRAELRSVAAALNLPLLELN